MDQESARILLPFALPGGTPGAQDHAMGFGEVASEVIEDKGDRGGFRRAGADRIPGLDGQYDIHLD
jgi:hypothetical protein